MCNYTYHHYPSCGHISNWSMTSCPEYTNKLRLAGPRRSASCPNINASHDLLLSTEPSMCVQCESEWAASLSDGSYQAHPSASYRQIEGLGITSAIFEIDARIVDDFDSSDGDLDSAGHSDNGQSICLGAVDGESGDGDSSSAGHSDNGQSTCLGAVAIKSDNGDVSSADHSDNGQSICSRAVADESDSHERPEKRVAGLFDCAQGHPSASETAARVYNWSISVSASATNALGHVVHGGYPNDSKSIDWTDSLGGETACATSSDESSCESSTCGSLCGSELLRYNIFKLRVDKYIQERKQKEAALEADCDAHNADTFGDENLPDPNDKTEHDSNQSCIDIDRMQQRIEATVYKRIEEDKEKQARADAISKRLDRALLLKDEYFQRQRNAELGIEEDPHLWETESLTPMWNPKPSDIPDNTSEISPCTCSLPKSQGIDILTPQPQMHLYSGNMFAATAEEAQQKGLREARPYAQGEWEGFLRAFSAADASRLGLMDAEHMRGCCDERPAPFHLFFGLMHAPSEAEAQQRWLEDIRRVPGEDGKFYGLLRADDVRHARAMGLSEIQHPWGCCSEGLFTLPDRPRHLYTGFMGAISLAAVAEMGLCGARPVPGECGDYYGGIYTGYVEAYSELDALEMGLMEAEHAVGCCAKAGVSIADAGHTYYGYMYACSEAEAVDRGLVGALLVPGFDIKYSGYLRAGSEGEAKALGLFEPSRIDGGNTRIPEGFL